MKHIFLACIVTLVGWAASPAYCQDMSGCSLWPNADFITRSDLMLPTLIVNETVGGQCYRRTNPAFDGINELQPSVKLGDVVVLRRPGSPDYVRRIVGLPGDTVQMEAGRLFINGDELPRVADGTYTTSGDGPPVVLHKYTETLPNSVSYDILKASDDGPLDNTKSLHVPRGYVFVMGDSRDDSLHSRNPDFGLIPAEYLVARVLINR